MFCVDLSSIGDLFAGQCCETRYNGRFRLPRLDPCLARPANSVIWVGNDLAGQQDDLGHPITNGFLRCGRACLWECSNRTVCPGAGMTERRIYVVIFRVLDGSYWLRIVLGGTTTSNRGIVWGMNFGNNLIHCNDFVLSVPFISNNDTVCTGASHATIISGDPTTLTTDVAGLSSACCTMGCFDSRVPWQVQAEITGAGPGPLHGCNCADFDGTWIFTATNEPAPTPHFQGGPCRWSIPVNICNFVEFGLEFVNVQANILPRLFWRRAVGGLGSEVYLPLTEIGPTFASPDKDKACSEWVNLTDNLGGALCNGNPSRVRLTSVTGNCP